MATYYVNSATGDDGNDGLSIANAWQTVAKVNSETFDPGDSVLFRRDRTWREELIAPSSGNGGSGPITFGAYAVGVDPIFDGSELIANADFSAYVPAAASERLRDGGFESWDSATDLHYWTEVKSGTSTVSQDAVDFHGGANSVKFVVDASNSSAAVTVNVYTAKNTAATLSLWYKTEAGKTAYIQLKNTGANVWLKSDGTWATVNTAITLPAAVVWTLFTINFNTHASYNAYMLTISRQTAASSTMRFDDVSLLAKEESANVYRAAWTMGALLEPMVWEDEVRLVDGLYVDMLYLNAGRFVYDSVNHFIYVHASDSSDVTTNGKDYELPIHVANIDDNGRNYLIFENLHCKKTYSQDGGTWGGIVLSGSHNQVNFCESHNNRRHCLQFYIGSDNCTASGCTLYDSASTTPISVYGGSTTDNLITGCDVYNGYSAAAIIIHGGPINTTIEHCAIHQDLAMGYPILIQIDTPGGGTIIRQNHLYGYAKVALATATSDDISFYYNIIDASLFYEAPAGFNYYATIYLDTATDNKIYNNVFYGGIYHDLKQVNNSTGTLFKNNILSVRAGGSYISVASGSQTSSVYDYNDYYNATGTPFNWIGTAYNFADWKTNSSQDAHSLNVDPLFTSSSDFHLQLASTMRRAGVNVSLTEDYDGDTVPGYPGKAPDLGAYESGGFLGLVGR